MRSIILTISLFISSVNSLVGQDNFPYEWKKSMDWTMAGIAIATNGYTLYQEPRVAKPNTELLRSWSRDEISSWERSATYNWSPTADHWSDWGQNLAAASPLLLAFNDNVRKNGLLIFSMFMETMLLNQGIVGTFKVTVQRRRPYVFNEEAPFEIKYRRQVYYSFVSGHTAASAAAAYFTAQVFADLNPDSKYKKWIWAGAMTIPAITGYLRYEAGRHFLSDVAAGYSLGAILGVMVPRLHRKQDNWQVSTFSNNLGTGLSLIYQF